MKRGLRVVAAAVVLVVTGCDSTPGVDATRATTPTRVDAVRTTPDGRGLVAAYLGGSCDGPASLHAVESPDHVDVEVRIASTGVEACDDVGHPRTVTTTLASPLGSRAVRVDGRPVAVFEGSRLRAPTALPTGFRLVTETGDQDGGQTWTMTYGVPFSPTASACTPGRGVLTVEEAPLGTGDLVPPGATGTVVAIGSQQASLYHRGSASAELWALIWSAYGGDIALTSAVGCEGDRPLDGDELVALARTLQPL